MDGKPTTLEKLTNNKPFRDRNVFKKSLELDVSRLVSRIEHLSHKEINDLIDILFDIYYIIEDRRFSQCNSMYW